MPSSEVLLHWGANTGVQALTSSLQTGHIDRYWGAVTARAGETAIVWEVITGHLNPAPGQERL